MRLPRFSAEASLYPASATYRTAESSNSGGTGVRPAQGFPLPDCYFWCLRLAEYRCRMQCPPHSIDCIPMCFLRARAHCRQVCHWPA